MAIALMPGFRPVHVVVGAAATLMASGWSRSPCWPC